MLAAGRSRQKHAEGQKEQPPDPGGQTSRFSEMHLSSVLRRAASIAEGGEFAVGGKKRKISAGRIAKEGK